MGRLAFVAGNFYHTIMFYYILSIILNIQLISTYRSITYFKFWQNLYKNYSLPTLPTLKQDDIQWEKHVLQDKGISATLWIC